MNHSAAAREALLTCRPSALPQLITAVEHGSPALANQALCMASVQPSRMYKNVVMTCSCCVAAGIMRTLAVNDDSRAKVLQGLRTWQLEGLTDAILKPVR